MLILLGKNVSSFTGSFDMVWFGMFSKCRFHVCLQHSSVKGK